jgi:hypothetical protein
MVQKLIPMSYYDLLDACALPGCPVCRLEAKIVRNYLDAILYESVNDPDVQSGLRRSWGYCRAHASRLPNVPGGPALGVAILFRGIIGDALKEIEQTDYASASRWSLKQMHEDLDRRQPAAATEAIVARLQPKAQCPACAHRDSMIDLALDSLLEALNRSDEPMRLALSDSAGLCLPHLRRAFELTRDETSFAALRFMSRAMLARLKHELNEFVRKNDYRFQHEGFGPEGDSWRRALAWLVGEE